MLLISVADDLLDVVRRRVRVRHHLVVHALVANLAETASMMRPICVLALSRLLLVSFAQITEVAHELSPMLSVVMTARVQALQTL